MGHIIVNGGHRRRGEKQQCIICNALLPRGLLFVIEYGHLRIEFRPDTRDTCVTLLHKDNNFIRLYSEIYFAKRVFVICVVRGRYPTIRANLV